MKWIIPLAFLVLSIAFVHAQTTQSTHEQTFEQTAKSLGLTPEQYKQQLAGTAKDFRMEPEELDKFLRREMGDPIAVDNGLYVGIKRDSQGHIARVQINTHDRSVEFNRQADDEHAGLQYFGSEISPNAYFNSTTDLDGDGRIDIIMLRHTRDDAQSLILLRIGDKFEPAQGLGEHKFKLLSDQRIMAFDRTSREWIEQPK